MPGPSPGMTRWVRWRVALSGMALWVARTGEGVDGRNKCGHDGAVAVWGGACPLLVQGLVEVVPLRVEAVDEADLPGARPVLHGALALDGGADVVVALVIDEAR